MKIRLLKPKLPVIFLIVVFLLSSCVSPQKNNSQNSTPANKPMNIAEENFAMEQRSKFESAVAELERNHRLWQENKIVNYDFVVAKFAGGNTNMWNRSPVLIKIREGEKTSIEKASKSDNTIYSKMDGFEDFDTIIKLFNYMRRELETGKMIEVKYNKKLGYPEKVIIIYSHETHRSYSIEISKLEIIK